ncbi:MAG: UDP-N-acetylglucosamine 1-carboxyvinyltransferase [Oscillospiraceae bacterium]|jgi:UDP-N-acetylglucosamine 1-carboxyvinyltransferase|nr:UDP-N-acetylglucosamine 1-carboxyvinyltransferase [Oscillospiraceae bacterium]
MGQFIIQGGQRLQGEVTVQGAKNSALPILAATAAVRGTCVIHNCPRLTDVDATLDILRCLHCDARREGETITINTAGICGGAIPDSLMREMRSSIIFLGPLLSALGRAEMSSPGGCEIGQRPIDLHIAAMRAMGVQIQEDGGRLHCHAPEGLRGARIALSFPSVGATENIMIAATTAKGSTTLTNAAREPEIADLAAFLNRCGARIHGAGEGTVLIEGVSALTGTDHTVIPDRIAAATFLTAAAITRGDVLLRRCVPEHMDAMIALLEQGGTRVHRQKDELRLTAYSRPRRLPTVRTMPYPGFPTDAQAAAMVLAAVADGTSLIIENIFENRLKHVAELGRMGAHIRVEGHVAIVDGVAQLTGSQVDACDLRAGAALVLAGLAAQGETTVRHIRHVDRGCQHFEADLAALGAKIRREA